MFLLMKPSETRVRDFIISQGCLNFSYAEVGATRGDPPSGFVVDHYRVRLGQGEAAFTHAVEALRRWEMFHLGWLRLCWPDTPIRVGSAVAVLVRHYGFWR